MNYNAKMLEILEKLGERPTLTNLFQVKDDLVEVANFVTRLPMFTDPSCRLLYVGFVKQLDGIKKKDQRIITAWMHFCDKVVHAPTPLHISGVVICVIPALVYAMNSKEDSKIILLK